MKWWSNAVAYFWVRLGRFPNFENYNDKNKYFVGDYGKGWLKKNNMTAFTEYCSAVLF